MRDPLADRAAATPAATALVDAPDGGAVDYATLDGSVDRFAGRLSALGVGPGDRVAALLPTRPATVRALFAAWRLGATFAPLNVRAPAADLDAMVDALDPAALVCGAGTESEALAAAGDVPVASVDDPDEGARALADVSAADVTPVDRPLDEDRLVVFTSGTTGTPTGVRLTGRNIVASATASAFRLGTVPGDRWCVPLPMYHVGGLAVPVRTTLYGTTAVVHRSPDGLDSSALRATLAGHDCTALSVVPTTLRDLLDDGPLPDTLRFVLTGGAATPPSLVERCAARDVPVCPSYGMTETCSHVAVHAPGEAAAHPETVGSPLLWTRVSVVDEDGNPRPTGETGELVVEGPTVSPGTLGGTDRAGPLATGDRGHLTPDGRVVVEGRVGDVVVTGGENVDANRVAEAIRTHPDVADAAVVGLPDERWGERVAALVVRTDAALDADAVRRHCRERLADYEVPRTVGFAEVLPRTHSGTVDRSAVRDRLTGEGQV